MKKKLFIIIGIIILVLGITIFFIYQNDSIRFKISYEYINMMEYNNGKKIEVEIPYDNRIEYLDEKDLLTFLKEGTGIIYFGYNTCPWCRNVIPVLIDTVKKNDIDKIYYADTHSLDIKSIKNELFTLLNDYLREDENGKKVLAVPDIYFIKDGMIIGHHISAVDGYYNPYEEMTKKQKQELTNIYEELIEGMK